MLCPCFVIAVLSDLSRSAFTSPMRNLISFFVFFLPCGYYCSVSFTRVDLDWTVACDCCISLS